MGRLAAKDRDAALLRYFERKDLRAVGDALGTSEEAARKRVGRALERLRRYLTGRGVTLSATTLATALTGSAVQSAPAALAGTISTAVFAGAAAAAAGSTFNFLNLMTMTKLKAGLLGTAIIVGAGTPVAIQQQSLSRLRGENRELREQSLQLEQLRAENQQLVAPRTDADELDRLRKEVAELHRLRAEVAQLRLANSEENALRPGATRVGAVSAALSMNRPTPGLSLEGSRHSSVPRKFPSWEGLGVSLWSQCMRKSERRRSMNVAVLPHTSCCKFDKAWFGPDL